MRKLKDILITWDGLWSIPVAGALLAIVTYILIQFDPTADVFGLGLLQDVFSASFKLIVANTVAQVGVVINVVLFFGYSVSQLKEDFYHISPCQRLYILLCVFGVYVLAFALMQP